jgi:hypothetical protein
VRRTEEAVTPELAIVLALLAAAILLFALNKPRMDAVALVMLTVMPLTGVISMSDALAGFSDSNVVLLALHLERGDRGPDGAARAGPRRGPFGVAVPLRDDRRAGRVDRVHW